MSDEEDLPQEEEELGEGDIDLGTSDEFDDDWAYDNDMYEGVDGLEEFEPDMSEHESDEEMGEDGELLGDDDNDQDTDISNWEWTDEEEESEKENERMEDAGWENNRGYQEHEIMMIVVFGVGMVFVVGAIVYYFCWVSEDAPVDAKSGRKLTRK